MHQMQTASGTLVRLDGPVDPRTITLSDIAFHLSHINRFCGACAVPVSVAAHSVAVADALYAASKAPDPVGAAYGLLHDAHEAYCGDILTPMAGALAAGVGDQGGLAGHVAAALGAIKGRLDAAIHCRAGLPWPPPPGVATRVKVMDLRALETERRLFLDRDGRPRPRWPGWDDAPPPKLRTAPRALTPFDAEQAFLDRLGRYIPAARKTLVPGDPQ